MNDDLVSKAVLIEHFTNMKNLGFDVMPFSFIENSIESAPVVEAYTGAEYMHLLEIAQKMHTWIFLNTIDEYEVYDEIGLSDKDNALLGSLGKVQFATDTNVGSKIEEEEAAE